METQSNETKEMNGESLSVPLVPMGLGCRRDAHDVKGPLNCHRLIDRELIHVHVCPSILKLDTHI